MNDLKQKYKNASKEQDREKMLIAFSEIRRALELGEIRAAQREGNRWIVNSWVKEAILWGFRIGVLKEIKGSPTNYFDKDSIPLQEFYNKKDVRLVPGGSSIRSGCYVSNGTVVMPPSYINIGAYVDEGCLIDSHALVGSCAQVGKNVHLSAASQIGGVLEPVGALPVIIEDNVFIGGNCGIYEGTIVKNNAVIGTGVILNGSIPVFDNTTGDFIKKTEDTPLTIPENAVVISGSRPITRGVGVGKNIQVYCPIIIKYRDYKTGESVTLEEMLR